MSVSGTGAQADPYIVTTWAELVAKAAENGKYVKVGNDIDVMLEYSDGSAPTLVLNGYVDGDNKNIKNWYCTGDRRLIQTSNHGYVINTNFVNINTTYSLIYNLSEGNENYVTVRNCKFAGTMSDGFLFEGQRDTRCGKIDSVAVNIKGGNLRLLYNGSTVLGGWSNLNIKIETNATILCEAYYQGLSSTFHDSYFDIKAPNLVQISQSSGYNKKIYFNNCAIDLKTDNAVTFDSGNSMLSIFNSTNAPNAVGTANKIVGVDNTHWLDADYLANTVGFNIIESE